MSKNILAVSDICAIIKECGKNGVSEFSYLGMKIAFSTHGVSTFEEVEITPEVQAKVVEVASETSFKDEYKLVRDELDQLVIEDPLAFEEALRRGDLKDERA